MATKRNFSKSDLARENGNSLFAPTRTSEITPLRSYLLLAVYVLAAVLLGSSLHYQLPQPKSHRGISPQTDAAEFSEYNALETITYLGETLGYRILFFFSLAAKNFHCFRTVAFTVPAHVVT
jgi:hypothetical protein